MLTDSYLHKGKRKKLVTLLQEKGIKDTAVLDAVQVIPRHIFVESALHHEAYEDKALPIAEGQTISQPYTVAFMTEALQLSKGMKILEIGTGSGYQAAVLCAMGLRVFSVERNARLHAFAKSRLEKLGFDPYVQKGDGSEGWKRYAPYQRIIVTAAAPSIPRSLQNQLDIGGKMIIPVGGREQQTMTIVTRLSTSDFQVQRLNQFRFVPLIGRYGWEGKEGKEGKESSKENEGLAGD
ncbi:MAG: protein-L-isoaspartate(D-aspartate) O-methyltransferase [Bacteroidia bacterium]